MLTHADTPSSRLGSKMIMLDRNTVAMVGGLTGSSDITNDFRIYDN